MKRLMAITGAVALVAACADSPKAQSATPGNELTAPAATASAAAAGTAPGAAAPAATPATTAAATPVSAEQSKITEFREITLPAGTVLPVDLETSVGSDISRVEQPVQARLRRAITRNGVEVLRAGAAVNGHVTSAQRPGKVKGRGVIAMRFTEIDTPGAGLSRISSATISRVAPATKQKDTLEIVGPAAAGAVIGRIAGGKGAARKGAVIGGAAGTGYVLSTRGKEVRLGKGANLAVRLTAPLKIRVPVAR